MFGSICLINSQNLLLLTGSVLDSNMFFYRIFHLHFGLLADLTHFSVSTKLHGHFINCLSGHMMPFPLQLSFCFDPNEVQQPSRACGGNGSLHIIKASSAPTKLYLMDTPRRGRTGGGRQAVRFQLKLQLRIKQRSTTISPRIQRALVVQSPPPH